MLAVCDQLESLVYTSHHRQVVSFGVLATLGHTLADTGRPLAIAALGVYGTARTGGGSVEECREPGSELGELADGRCVRDVCVIVRTN